MWNTIHRLRGWRTLSREEITHRCILDSLMQILSLKILCTKSRLLFLFKAVASDCLHILSLNGLLIWFLETDFVALPPIAFMLLNPCLLFSKVSLSSWHVLLLADIWKGWSVLSYQVIRSAELSLMQTDANRSWSDDDVNIASFKHVVSNIFLFLAAAEHDLSFKQISNFPFKSIFSVYVNFVPAVVEVVCCARYIC